MPSSARRNRLFTAKMAALMFYCWAAARVLQHPIYIALYILMLLAGVSMDLMGFTQGYSSLGTIRKCKKFCYDIYYGDLCLILLWTIFNDTYPLFPNQTLLLSQKQ